MAIRQELIKQCVMGVISGNHPTIGEMRRMTYAELHLYIMLSKRKMCNRKK